MSRKECEPRPPVKEFGLIDPFSRLGLAPYPNQGSQQRDRSDSPMLRELMESKLSQHKPLKR